MTESQERRAPGTDRVAVARVVDICGRDATVPAFEAESANLSGRGMHVKTPSYLPPPGAPLVCRLEEGGREIIVEGVVAWAREGEGGGEFGMQFTALDSGSVETLKALCGMKPAEDEAPPARAEAAPTLVPKAPSAPSGAAVKLHIDGLGAPMKARVKDAGTRKLQVGSNLEFLKVGRNLEVENLDEGERRGAKIDAVSIAIDPESQVPQLVVVLRYDGAETTPEPTVVGAEESPDATTDAVEEAWSQSAPVGMDDTGVDDDEDAASFDDRNAELRDRVDAMAASMGRAAHSAGEKLATAGGFAATHFMKWAKAGSARLADAAARRGQGEKRRSTSPPPTVPSGQRRLRPQNGAAADDEPTGPRRKVVIAGAAGALVLVSVLGIAMAARSSKPEAAPPSAVAAATAATTPAAPLAPPAAPAPAMDPTSAVAAGATPAAAAIPGQRPGVVANVPLFGPTPMATLEPAPLAPPPDPNAPAPAAGSLAVPGTPTTSLVPPANEARMDEEEAPAAKDESFSGGADEGSRKDEEKKSTEVHPEDVKPWGDGTMHLPIVHRMKLDAPGAALKGQKLASGFTVLIPHRKVESSGTAIVKRDDRISAVRAKNGPDGAHVTFVFRGKVPSYKVRLRNSSVEFFVSSP